MQIPRDTIPLLSITIFHFVRAGEQLILIIRRMSELRTATQDGSEETEETEGIVEEVEKSNDWVKGGGGMPREGGWGRRHLI